MVDKDKAKRTKFIENVLDKLERLKTFVNDNLETAKLRRLETMLKDLDDTWALYKKCIPPYDIVDESITLETLEEISNLYFEVHSEIEDKIFSLKKIANATENKSIPISANVKLPEISLQPFNGNYMEWKSFIATFNSLIDSNASLSKISKFQYLKRSLLGTAAQAIESLDFSEDNYDEARNILKERFEKEYFICEQHIKTLFSLKSSDKPSARFIIETVDQFNSHLRSLKSLGRPINHWDDLIVHLVLSKLDSETRSRWIDVAPTSHLPTYDELCVFLEIGLIS